MSNFGGKKVTSEELAQTSLIEFKILLEAGQVSLDNVVLVGDQFVTTDDGELVKAGT